MTALTASTGCAGLSVRNPEQQQAFLCDDGGGIEARDTDLQQGREATFLLHHYSGTLMPFCVVGGSFHYLGHFTSTVCFNSKVSTGRPGINCSPAA